MSKLKKKAGFTLMEMLIVVAIIAVLVAIAIPVFNGSLEKSRQAVDAANARSLKALLATMVMDGQVDFTGGSDKVTGFWVLVTRDSTVRPETYEKSMQGTMFCGGDAGVKIYGETSGSWNRENEAFRKVVENSIGVLDSKSGGGNQGWDWYLVEYVYNKEDDTQECFVYSGKNNGKSGYDEIKNSLKTNALAKYMEGRK